MRYQYTNSTPSQSPPSHGGEVPSSTFSPSRSRREGGEEEGVRAKVYEKAVKLLSMRLHTTGELYRKLKSRGFKDQDIRPVLRRLEELKFLDDERFAEIFVDNLKRYKDFGYYGIKAKLFGRQIPGDLAEDALAQFFTVEDEIVVARRLLGKLKRQGRTQWEQLMRSLQSRGFRSEVMRQVL